MMNATRSALRGRGLSLLLALATAVLVAVLLLAALSSSFVASLGLFFLGPFSSAWYLGNMLAGASILVMAGLAASVAFSSRNFNLGGEGQVYLGAIAATAFCLAFPRGEGPLFSLLALVAGSAAGALLAWCSGALKLSLGVDELISSFLISAAAVYLGGFLVAGPLQDPTSNFVSTRAVPEAYRLARIFPPSTLSTGAFLSLAVLVLSVFVRARTRFGFELGMVGRNAEFARYGGIDTKFYVWAPMTLSGALYGLAGALLVLGSYYKSMKGFTAGIGWSGVAVALVAGNAPLALLPSALLFAYIDSGSKAVMVGSDVTGEIVSVIQATVFFLVTARAAEGFLGGSLRRPRRAARPGPGAGQGSGSRPPKGGA
jgi:simple sugar transport system permease protein